jgi:Protein of unknown function (DUF3306)
VADGEARNPTVPTDVPAGGNQEAFLSRWSRRKDEARRAPPEPAPQKGLDPKETAPELPPLDSLTIDSDYRSFFHPKVDEDVRRAALKKLFSDPHFNVMDGLDVYIDDYSKTEPIPAAMMAGLRQAQKIFEWAKEDELARQNELNEKSASDNAQPSLDPPGSQPLPDKELPVTAPDVMPAPPRAASEQAKS